MALSSRIALHDVEDVEAFVHGTIRRAERQSNGLRFTEDERDDLFCEGLALLYELAERFEPHREGYAQGGRFSGYAAQLLPRRLGDYWHASNPTHHRVTITAANGEQRRQWVYLQEATSLDKAEGDMDGVELHALPRNQWTPANASPVAA